jgi:hypothetical protein
LLPFELMLRLLLLPLSFESSSFPCIAFRRRLFLGPISSFSSKICRFCNRGRMISHTLS